MTPQQKRLYDIIKADLDATGVCPSFEEMRERMGLGSKSGIHRLLAALEERGHIRRLPHKARCIEIVGHTPIPWRINDHTFPEEAGTEAPIAEVIRAAHALKKAPWHKEPCVTITENSYQALRKALAKLGAV